MTIPTTTTYSLLKLQWWAEKSIRMYPLSFCLHLLLPRPVADVGFERKGGSAVQERFTLFPLLSLPPMFPFSFFTLSLYLQWNPSNPYTKNKE